MEVCPSSHFLWCGFFLVSGCHFVWHMSSQWRSQKLLQGLVSHELRAYLSIFDVFLTQWIMAILLKGCKPDNFESHNSLKLSFRNIRGLLSNFVECDSLNQTLLTFWLYAGQTWMTHLILAISVGQFIYAISFLAQLDSGILCLWNDSLWPVI